MMRENQSKPVNFLVLTGLTGSVTGSSLKTPCISREEDLQEIRVKPVKLVKCKSGDRIVAKERTGGIRAMSALRLPKSAAHDLARRFIEDRCDIGSGFWAHPSNLYDAYVEWTISTKSLLMSKQQFGHVLSALGYPRSMAPGGTHIRVGLFPRRVA